MWPREALRQCFDDPEQRVIAPDLVNVAYKAISVSSRTASNASSCSSMSSATLVGSQCSAFDSPLGSAPQFSKPKWSSLEVDPQLNLSADFQSAVLPPPPIYMPSSSSLPDHERLRCYQPRSSRLSITDTANAPESGHKSYELSSVPLLPSSKHRFRSQQMTNRAPEVPPIPPDLRNHEAMLQFVTQPRHNHRRPIGEPSTVRSMSVGASSLGFQEHCTKHPRVREVTRGKPDVGPVSIFSPSMAPPPRELPPSPPAEAKNRRTMQRLCSVERKTKEQTNANRQNSRTKHVANTKEGMRDSIENCI